MGINEIINRRYSELYKMLRDADKTLYESITVEDLFHEVLLTAMKKYKDKDITEEEGFEYLKKTLLREILFSKKRKKTLGLITYLPQIGDKEEESFFNKEIY